MRSIGAGARTAVRTRGIRTLAAAGACLLLAAGCGSRPAATHPASSASQASASSSSSTSSGPKVLRLSHLVLTAQQPVRLAPTASKLCATPPRTASLSAFPMTSSLEVVPKQLQIVASQGDGVWFMSSFHKHYSLYGAGYNAPTRSGYVYFDPQQLVPAKTANVMLCAEYYDATRTTSSKTGNWFTAQYSGTNPKGPIQGAYDNVPEAYATTGTHHWLVASFTMGGINFAAGDSGIGKENAGASFRLYYNTPTYFDRFWIVTKGVPSTRPLSTLNTKTLSAFIAKYH